MVKSRRRPAVFLDRDGTILNETGYLGDPQKMKFYPDAIKGLKLLAGRRIPLFVVSNQSGIGRGYFSREQYERVNRAFLKFLKRKGVKIQEVYICPHRPEAGCACRKPKPGLLKKAARRYHIDLAKSFVVGDQDRDVRLARNAKAQGILVLTGKGKLFRDSVRQQGKIFSKLSVAAKWILKQMEKDLWIH